MMLDALEGFPGRVNWSCSEKVHAIVAIMLLYNVTCCNFLTIALYKQYAN